MLRIPYRLIRNLFSLLAFAVATAVYQVGRLWPRRTRTFVEVRLPAQMPLRPAGGPLSFLSRPRGYLDWYRDFEGLARDPDVDGIVVYVRNLGWSWARAEHVRGLLTAVRARGKEVVCAAHTLSTRSYYVASAAGRIAMTPPGGVELMGEGVDLIYFADGLERLGVRAQFVHIGRYKTAAHRFIKSGPTRWQSENAETLLGGLRDELLGQTSAAARPGVATALGAGPLSAGEAVAHGLVDLVAYEDELPQRLEARGEDANARRRVRVVKAGEVHLKPTLRWRPLWRRPQVAVVDFSGVILMGDEGLPLAPTRRAIAYREYRSLLRALARNRNVRAVVFAIDSPGGSALASDLLWREARQLAEKKPLFASLQSVAGSGGYYLAAACPRIFAYETSLTGSIGVVAGRFSLGEVLARLGVGHAHVSGGPASELHSPFLPMDGEAQRQLRRSAWAIYRRFVARVAQGRGMSRARVHALGEGRVYTGRQGLEAGLVDEIGDLHAAIGAACAAARLRLGSVDVTLYPRRPGGLRAVLGPRHTGEAHLLPSLLGEAAGLLGFAPDAGWEWLVAATLFARERILALGPGVRVAGPVAGPDADAEPFGP